MAGHMTKTWFLKYELHCRIRFLELEYELQFDTNFALTLQGKCWKDNVVTFIENLNVTIKHLTRYKQKVALAAMLEGKSMPSNMAANTNHTNLLKNQSTIKYLP